MRMFQLPSTQRCMRRNENSQVCASRKIVPNSIYSARQLCCRMCGSPAVEHSHALPSFTLSQSHYGTRSPNTFGKRSDQGTKKTKILDSRSTASCLVSEMGGWVFLLLLFAFLSPPALCACAKAESARICASCQIRMRLVLGTGLLLDSASITVDWWAGGTGSLHAVRVLFAINH